MFTPQEFFLSEDDEKKEYDFHENSPEDVGYRRFLGRLMNPVCEWIPPKSCGLDFGSGPGPTLSVMFEEAGFDMRVYDKFYAPDASVFLENHYDFITASEVIEHLHNPAFELQRLWTCLKKHGVLGIMTKMVIDQGTFAKWHYKNDRTHVIFFSKPTFEWLAKKWQARLEFFEKDVVLFFK